MRRTAARKAHFPLKCAHQLTKQKEEEEDGHLTLTWQCAMTTIRFVSLSLRIHFSSGWMCLGEFDWTPSTDGHRDLHEISAHEVPPPLASGRNFHKIRAL